MRIQDPLKNKAEYQLLSLAKPYVIGVDEVGLGSWAGPAVACAVAVPNNWIPPKKLNDSKKLSPKQREELFEELQIKVKYVLGIVQPDLIDRIGILIAIHQSFAKCITELMVDFPESLVVIDGNVRLLGIDHINFPKADGIVPAVMAASVIGKVVHDRHMWELAKKYPGYQFHKSQGYGTAQHREALARLGPCPIHRKSYLPIKNLKKENS